MMLFFENISLAISSLRANKVRALLTMLGIIIGIGAVIAIVTVGNSLTLSISDSMSSVGANNITVGLRQRENEEETTDSGAVFRDYRNQKQPKEEDYFTDEMIEAFRETYPDEIADISISESLGSGKVTKGEDYANVSVVGVNDGFFTANDLTMLKGNILSGKAMEEGRDVALVSDYFVDNLYNGDPGKAMGETVEITIGKKYYTYTIVGVYEYQAMSFSMTSKKDTVTDVYTPVKSVQRKTHNTSGYSSFTVVIKTAGEAQAFIPKINHFFDRYYRKNRNFELSTFTLESMVSEFTGIMGTVSTAISIIAGISLLVGGIGVMNIMLVSISERTREIGTRKALGATNASIRTQFIVEAIVICLIGGMIGIVVGVGGGIIGAKALGFAAAPSLSSILISLIFSMVIGVFFGFYPANKAAKMNPIDALRYE